MDSLKAPALGGIGYWEQYWLSQRHYLPILIDHNFNYHLYMLDRLFRKYLDFDRSHRFLQIGCGSGAWLIYFSRVFGYDVAGVDYSATACELARKNLKMNGVAGSLLNEDIFRTSLRTDSFDVVFSSGFIEHFDNPVRPVQAHYDLLKKGGRLIIIVPNFSGLNKFIIALFSRHMLKLHNLSILNLESFKALFGRLELDIEYLGHFGGFDPVIYDLPFLRNRKRHFSWNKALNNILKRMPPFENRLISPDLVIIARKV